MKIKDLLNNNWSFKTRLQIARRIMRCTNLMKRELANWKRTGIIPNRRLSLEVNGEEYMTISIHELVKTYGLDPLSAMLFFDDLIKANISEDKTLLINLIERLQNGQTKKSLSLSASRLEDIKKNQPDLWNEYISIQNSVGSDRNACKDECVNIGETSLPE